MNRRRFIGVTLSGVAAAVLHSSARSDEPTASTRTVGVPLDHAEPDGRRIELSYLVVDALEPKRPTVFVVADGQQFYVRPDVLPTYRALFGGSVNIVGIAGRGTCGELLAELGDPASGDWAKAYRLLQFRQWTADIDAIRRELLGREGRAMIYGVSGGGQLAHQYLATYGHSVSQCYTEAAVFSLLEARLGLQHDRFWSEIEDDERDWLRKALAARPERRELYAQLLQRQNFFIEPDALPAARRALIAAIRDEDEPALDRAAEEFQVHALNRMMSSPASWAIRVRQYEFVQPLAAVQLRSPDELRPDIENSIMWARPLLELHERGEIGVPDVDMRAWHSVEAEVTVVAGRYDHTCDYRSQIALASHYPNHCLLLLNDDHRMQRWKKSAGTREALLQAWPHGFAHASFKAALAKIEPLRWRET